MSKKNRAQHNVSRRHGDRNVQTRYSGKHQEQHMEHSCGGACKGAGVSEVREIGGLTFIPKVKVTIKIGELHLHGDEHMETFNFHNGCMATVLHGTGDTEMEIEGETEVDYEDEEDDEDEEDEFGEE